MNTDENDIVNIALENLKKHTQIRSEWKNYAFKNDKRLDGEIVFNIDKRKIRIFTEVKKSLRNHQLQQLGKTAHSSKPFLLVVEHISPKIKDDLREMGIAYLEANGNIYFREAGIYLWIDNQKTLELKKEKENRAFNKTGLRVVFQFLLDEQLINCAYRELAKMAGVGLGNINYVMNGMKAAGFLVKVNKKEYKLTNKKELLEKWMDAFADRLKPKLHLGTFRFLKEENNNNWRATVLEKGKTYWGGEPAADIMTNYLKPEILTMYTDENRSELIKHYRLIPDEKGNVEVYRKFWNYSDENRNTVDPVLVYADLMNTGNGRCMETANKIFDEYQLANKF